MTPPSESSQRRVDYRKCRCPHHSPSMGHTFVGENLECKNYPKGDPDTHCGKSWQAQQRKPTKCPHPSTFRYLLRNHSI